MTSCQRMPRDNIALKLCFFVLLSLALPSSCQGNTPCSPNLCLNTGSCIDGKCVCSKGFTGIWCKTPIDSYLGIDNVWKPSVKEVLQDKVGFTAINPGRQLVLKCPANGAIGRYQTHWTLNETLLDTTQDPMATINKVTGELVINDPGRNRSRYEGLYQCRISNVFGQVLGSRAQVKIKVVGSFISTSPITYNITINQKLAIKCPEHTYSEGINYQWVNASTKEIVNFPRPRVMTSQEDGTLYFSHVTNDDFVAVFHSKGIQCGITMDGQELIGPIFSGTVFLSKVGDNGRFVVSFFKTPPSTIIYLPMKAQTQFYSFPSGRSPVSLIWLKDSSPIIPSRTISLFEFNRTLRLSNAGKSAEGKYSYKATDVSGSSVLTLGMTIRVIDPFTEKLNIQHKGTVTLICMKSSGFSYPAQWYYNGINVNTLLNSDFESRGYLNQNGSFTIKTAVPRDTGVYQCFVDGIAASLYYLFVMEFESRPNISLSETAPYPGSTIEFKCFTGLGPRSPLFSWFQDDKLVVPDVRHTIFSDDKHSVLRIRKVFPEDKGNYSCVVSKGNQKAKSLEEAVNVVPVIAIVPRTLTKTEDESANFSCKVLSGDITGMTMMIIKLDSNQTVVRRNSIIINDLSINNGNKSKEVICQCILVKNNNLTNPVSKSQHARLTIVKRDFPKCFEEVADEVKWSTTAAGKFDIQRCPGIVTGQVSRRCIEHQESPPQWGDINYGNCTSAVFQWLLLEAEAIVSDYKSSFNSSSLLEELKNATGGPSVDKGKGLYGGDLEHTVRILAIFVNNSKVENSTESEQQNFLEICSNILEPINTKPWIQFENQEMKISKTLWNVLVVTIDTFGLQQTSQLKSDQNKTLTTKNIVMRTDNVGQQSKIRDEGLAFKHEESSIFLPAEIFYNKTTEKRVVSLVYKTLNNVMRLQKTNNETQAGYSSILVPSNTTMVTSTVRPEPPKKLQSNVIIVVQNKEVLDPVPPRTCVFWRDGLPSVWDTDGCRLVTYKSNKHVTTCECDHLTVFAALMDPYGGPLPLEHRKALELISTIGCAISLFAILVVIVVTAFFWKSVKGPRAIVLLNICVAIAVVCILVIAEGTARNTKVGCTVMAVLLHYFLLAVFCWMLCEGILLYLIIVKVIGAKVEEKIKLFLIFGWVFPAIIVGISLAATQTKGYGYYGNQTACWLAVENGLIWAFVGPAIVIFLTNLIVLILVIRQMMGTRHVQSKSRDVKVRMGVKATAILLPLLGVTWVFGLLAFNSATLAFKYIFAIFNSLQGLMIFIFHCLLNKQIQDAVKRKYEKYSSSDSTATGPRSKDKQKIKKEKPVQSSSANSQAKFSQLNEYEMDLKKRNSTAELLGQSGSCHVVTTAPDKAALEEVDEILIHEPKDESSYSKINDGYQNKHPIEQEHDFLLTSNVKNTVCLVAVETDPKVKIAGLADNRLENSKDRSEQNDRQRKKANESVIGNRNLLGSDQDHLGDSGLSSPPESFPALHYHPGVTPLAFENQSFDKEDENKHFTPSSFDFSPPISTWSVESQRSLSLKSSISDGSNDSSDSDSSRHSIALNSINENSPKNLEHSFLNSDDSPEKNLDSDQCLEKWNDSLAKTSDLDQYLASMDKTDSIFEFDDLEKNGNKIFETGSDTSSSSNEFTEYDLVDAIEKEGGGSVVFKGIKKTDSFEI